MKLVILDGPMRGHQYPVDKSKLILGRDPGTDVPLPLDAHISRFHCQLVDEGGRTWLEDLGSANGTWMDGQQLSLRTALPARAIFRVGHTHMCLLEDAESSAGVMEELLRSKAQTLGGATAPGASVQFLDEKPGVRLNVESTVDPKEVLSGETPVDGGAMERLKTRLRVIQEVSEALAGKLDSGDLFQAVLDNIMKVLAAERAFVLGLDEGGKKLSILASRRADGKPSGDVTISRTLVDKSVRERVSVLISDTLDDEQLRAAPSVLLSSMRSAMCVPLLHQERVLALLLLDNTVADAFSREDLELVTAIANQAAIALTNTRLCEELRHAYEELESAHDQLVQSEKLSTIGTLAASIAHDIGNVITPMTSLSSMIMRSQDIDPKLKGVFERQMQRLKALTTQLKSFSRPKPPVLAPLDLNKVVADSVSMVQTDARHHNVKVTLELEPELPQVPADANRLDQVFINLIVNAVQAIGEGGGEIVIRTRQQGDRVAVAFADSGPGIAEEHLQLLCKPFFTTKGNKQGTGLGLFSCKRIVEEEHGGRLEIESALGKGATFTVLLPRERADPTATMATLGFKKPA